MCISHLVQSAERARKAKMNLQTREEKPLRDGPGPQMSWEAHGTVQAMQGIRGPVNFYQSQSCPSRHDNRQSA